MGSFRNVIVPRSIDAVVEPNPCEHPDSEILSNVWSPKNILMRCGDCNRTYTKPASEDETLAYVRKFEILKRYER